MHAKTSRNTIKNAQGTKSWRKRNEKWGKIGGKQFCRILEITGSAWHATKTNERETGFRQHATFFSAALSSRNSRTSSSRAACTAAAASAWCAISLLIAASSHSASARGTPCAEVGLARRWSASTPHDPFTPRHNPFCPRVVGSWQKGGWYFQGGLVQNGPKRPGESRL